MTKQSVIIEALKLAEGERLEVVEALYESLEHPADAAAEQEWADEIATRLRQIDSGQVTLIDWAQVKSQLEKPGNDATTD